MAEERAGEAAARGTGGPGTGSSGPDSAAQVPLADFSQHPRVQSPGFAVVTADTAPIMGIGRERIRRSARLYAVGSAWWMSGGLRTHPGSAGLAWVAPAWSLSNGLERSDRGAATTRHPLGARLHGGIRQRGRLGGLAHLLCQPRGSEAAHRPVRDAPVQLRSVQENASTAGRRARLSREVIPPRRSICHRRVGGTAPAGLARGRYAFFSAGWPSVVGRGAEAESCVRCLSVDGRRPSRAIF